MKEDIYHNFFIIRIKRAKVLQILLFFVLSVCPVDGQVMEWADFLDDFMDSETDDDGTESDVDRLQEMHENPFNLNDCSRDDLLQLPFVGPQQADSILVYIRKNGAILSAGELLLVHGLDFYSRSALPLFVYFGQCRTERGFTSFFNQLLYGHQEVAGVATIPLYKRRGFKSSSRLSQRYAGGRVSGSLRYRNNYRNQLYVGLTAKNDDGEPFAKDGNYPFDSYSFYLFRNNGGILRSWIVGDYKIHIGKGLTSGIGFMNSGMGLLTSRHDHGQGIFAHSGSGEYGFLRGGAVSFAVGKLHVMLFGSVRKIDARVAGDSLFAVLTTGYHRLPLERQRKNNVQQSVAGASADVQVKVFHVGFSAVSVYYDHTFVRGNRGYQQYNMEGNMFTNMSLHYSYERKKVSVGGEVALTSDAQPAMLHDLRCEPLRNLRIFLQHRYYGKFYQAPLGWAYSGGGKCRGEHGIMLGLLWQPRKKWMLSGFVDGYRLLTPSYRALQPANGYTIEGEGSYVFSDIAKILIRYNLRSRQESSNKHAVLLYAMKHSLRLQPQINVGHFVFTTSLDGCCYKPSVGRIQYGRMLSERVSTTLLNFQLAMSSSWFHTADYQACMYVHQPCLRYTRNASAFFYHGNAGAFVIQRQMGKHLNFSGMFTFLHYTNRHNIGAADRTIYSSKKFDLMFQLRWLI
ncbi:MAG: helix-hairpin-helix domain-containing protein [Bacteroidaceae bacterium]|nr:helix-hairpin-helix domain-containing protein [Bacteroidaceae bacterium]